MTTFPGSPLPDKPTKAERAKHDAAFAEWCAGEDARIAGQRRTFLNLPVVPSREALQAAILGRAWALLDAGECEAADALLEFVPEPAAAALLDEFFKD